jgi:hypothetical protein
MCDEDDEIITRIGANGEVEYGIPISRELGKMIEFVAKLEGISPDEAASLLVKKGLEAKLQEIDAIRKSHND